MQTLLCVSKTYCMAVFEILIYLCENSVTQSIHVMEALITQGIKISVEPFYLPQESMPVQHRYVFAYRITIENLSQETVQLLRRHWHIVESNGIKKEVEGEGVVGEQPVLGPEERFQYTSWCPLMTDTGKMYGTFLMIRKSDEQQFRVEIPAFRLYPPFKMN